MLSGRVLVVSLAICSLSGAYGRLLWQVRPGGEKKGGGNEGCGSLFAPCTLSGLGRACPQGAEDGHFHKGTSF